MSAERKRILILIDWFDPAYKAGGQIQSCKNIIAALEDHYDFFVLTSDRDIADTRSFEGIKTNQWIEYGKNTRVYYANAALLSYSKIKSIIRDIKPHLVYLNSMYSYRFTILPLLYLRSTNIKMILAPSGMLQAGALQFSKWKKTIFLFLFRLAGFQKKIRFHATDDIEAHDIRKHISNIAEIVVARCLPSSTQVEWKPVVKKANELNAVYLSRITPKKNLSYLLNCLRKVQSKYRISLDVYGEHDDKIYYQYCLEIQKALPANVVCRFMGPVNNNLLADVYKNYQVFMLSTLGENFGYAIFEAFLYGKPVIISDRTPWNNLASQQRGFAIPLENEDEYVKAIEFFAGLEQEQYNQWSENAWQLGQQVQQSSELKEKYFSIFSLTGPARIVAAG